MSSAVAASATAQNTGVAAGGPAASDVPVIRRLEKDVVNRIAAGEVLHRPANALKELLENSLDAGSTHISVTLQGGGMKQLRIEDNGCGIRPEDFPILCERFATSKLSTFEDLSRISTFGFRGEALASLTHVAHVCITSKTEAGDCAFKAYFEDGRLVPAPGGHSKDPQPCAGVRGTVIIAEDLFHNIPVRLAALKNYSAEYTKCVNVVMQYAIQFAGVSMTCRQAGKNHADVHTTVNASRKDNIGVLYGHNIARELLPLEHSTEVGGGFKVEGFLTNGNFSSKRSTLVLFINNRLVESASIKKLVDTVYAPLLPKGGHPWVYLSLMLPPENLDVNVHPTKKEVHFLHEDEILEELSQAIQRVLEGANSSRVYLTQSVLGVPVSSSASNMVSSSPTALQHRPDFFSSPSSSSSPQRSQPRGVSSPEAASSSRNSFQTPKSSAATPRGSLSSSSASKRPEHKIRVDGSDRNIKVLFEHPDLADSLGLQGNQSGSPFRISPLRSPTPPAASSSGLIMDTLEDLESDAEASSVPMEVDGDERRPAATTASNNRMNDSNSRRSYTLVMEEDPSLEQPSKRLKLSHTRRHSDDGSLSVGETAPASDGPRKGLAEFDAAMLEAEHAYAEDVEMSASSSASAPSAPSSPPSSASPSSSAPRKRLPLGHRDAALPTNLRGVHTLVGQIDAQRHPQLTRLLAEHVFVGRVNDGFLLLQWLSSLYLVNVCRLSRAFFYEQVLRRFGVTAAIPLTPPASVRDLIMVALDSPTAQWTPADGPKEDIADFIVHLLLSKAEMLREYFSIDIDAEGQLCGLPLLLPHYVPPVRVLPFFLFRLAIDTDWTSEVNCFRDVSNQLARLYMIQHPSLYLDRLTEAGEPEAAAGAEGSSPAASSASSSSCSASSSENSSSPPQPAEEIAIASFDGCQESAAQEQPGRQVRLEWVVRNVLLPHCRSQLSPASALANDGTIVQIASLDKLYKVFERC